mgnify:CR=1 FL=1
MWLTYGYFKVNAEDRKLTDISPLQSISLRDGNLQQFKFLLDQAVELMHERPAPQLLLQYFLLNMDFLQQSHEFYLELMPWKRRPDSEKSYKTPASAVDPFLQAKVEQKNLRAHIGDALPGLIPAKQAWTNDSKGKGKKRSRGTGRRRRSTRALVRHSIWPWTHLPMRSRKRFWQSWQVVVVRAV